MSEPKGGVKTLAIRLPDLLHAQLAIVAHLEGLTLTDAIRAAIEGWIAIKRGEGDLATRAAIALEEIEAEATARRAAIQALLMPAPPVDTSPDEVPAEEAGRARPRRRGDAPTV